MIGWIFVAVIAGLGAGFCLAGLLVARQAFRRVRLRWALGLTSIVLVALGVWVILGALSIYVNPFP